MATHIIKTTDFVEAEEIVDESGFKIAKTAIFYAVASLVLAAILVPWNNSSTKQVASTTGINIDTTVTGSVNKSETRRTKIRRSVLQADPNTPCYVLANGKTEGDC